MAWALRLVALGLVIMAAGSAATAATAAQDRPDRNCRDDRGVDRCAAAQHREVLELFGMRPIEAHQTAGDQVRRVFYVDGYGRDLIAIAFVRPAGRDPMLSVHFPRRQGREPLAPMTASVSREAWEDILFRSEMFDRDLVQTAPLITTDGNQVISVCMHSWVYTVEAVDPPGPPGSLPARIRRNVEDACEDGLAQPFAVEAYRAALPMLPACASLAPELHRNEATMLAACGTLQGDRMAAAQVMNGAAALEDAHSIDDLARLQGVFDYNGTVEWNGERVGGGSNAAVRFWLTKLGERDQTNFYRDRIVGESPYRVRLTGFLERPVEGNTDGNGAYERAPVEQIWSHGPSREFQIETVVVGPFGRVPQND